MVKDACSPNKLGAFVQHAQSALTASGCDDERTVQHTVVSPLLANLGWSSVPTEDDCYSTVEYPITVGSGRVLKADYALLQSQKPMAFVETKAQRVSLKEEHRGQLASYLKQEIVYWGILTNGEEFEVYRLPNRSASDNEPVLYAAFTLSTLIDNLDVLNIFARENLASGASQSFAHEADVINNELEALDRSFDSLTEAFERVAGETVGPIAESVTKEIMPDIASLYETRLNAWLSGEEYETLPPQTEPTLAENDESVVPDGVIPPETPTAESLWTFLGAVGRFSETEGRYTNETTEWTDVEGYRRAIIALFEVGYLSVEDLPIASGHKRNILNTEPFDRTGQEMIDGQDIWPGVWLETTQDALYKIRTLKRLVEYVCDSTPTEPTTAAQMTAVTDGAGALSEQRVREGLAEIGITYDEVVTFSDDRPAKDQLIDAIDLLTDLGSVGDGRRLPFKVGRFRHLVNSEPRHGNDKEMQKPRQTENGYWVETHWCNNLLMAKRLQTLLDDIFASAVSA